jgi:hypothetical protein
MNRAVLGERPEVIPQVGMQNCQNEDRLFPLIKEGFRGLSLFLVDRRLQPPWSPFAKGENQFTTRAIHEIQFVGQPLPVCRDPLLQLIRHAHQLVLDDFRVLCQTLIPCGFHRHQWIHECDIRATFVVLIHDYVAGE